MYSGAGEQIWQNEEQKKAAKAGTKAAKAQQEVEQAALAQRAAQERATAAEELVDIKIEEARARGTAQASGLPSASVQSLMREVTRRGARESSAARRSQRNRVANRAIASRAIDVNAASKISTLTRGSTTGTALSIGSLIAKGLLDSN
jgi:hypothetical protein